MSSFPKLYRKFAIRRDADFVNSLVYLRNSADPVLNKHHLLCGTAKENRGCPQIQMIFDVRVIGDELIIHCSSPRSCS